MTNLSDTLAALSEAATQGEWKFEAGVEDSEGEFYVCHPGTVCDVTTVCNSRSEADAQLIVALVNAYRSGQLVPVPSVERVARLIAEELGDNYDDAPANKQEWTKTHGQFRGVFRDVNQPFRCDYDAAATAVIAAMKEGRE